MGGTTSDTGEILAAGSLTHATIQGNLTGNTAIDSSTAVVNSGYIQAAHIGSLAIAGNVTSGANSAGAIANSGAIRSSTDILSLLIGGEVTGTAANPVVISAAQGPAVSGNPKTDVAIQSVTIDHAVTSLDLLAGYNPTVSTTSNPAGAPLGTPVDGAAQIGEVHFGSTLSASNVVAGVEPDAMGRFGTAGNFAIAPARGEANLMSSIAEIIVAGQATGNSTAGDSFGFVAQTLGTVEVNGVILTGHLTAGTPVAVNGSNLYRLEVAAPR